MFARVNRFHADSYVEVVMHCPLLRQSVVALALLFACQLVRGAEIESVAMIWEAGEHNAFTDLTRWRGKWYITFREAEGHVGGDGKIRVLESSDGVKWDSAALIGETGIDLRDPKFSITPDDRLMIVCGGSVYEGKVLKGRQPRVTFSQDAREWTPPQRVLNEGEWLWRVTWHDGVAYGASYNAAQRTSAAAQEAAKSSAPVESGPAEWKLKLFASRDGVKYELRTHFDVPGHPNETTLRFLSDGRMVAQVRREGGDKQAWIGNSPAPYTQWEYAPAGQRIGGPNFIVLPRDEMWAVGRKYEPAAHTVLAKFTTKSYEPVLNFPSGGDTSYAGLVWHEDRLWVSYYSSHEAKKSRIYFAKVKLP